MIYLFLYIRYFYYAFILYKLQLLNKRKYSNLIHFFLNKDDYVHGKESCKITQAKETVNH